MKKQSSPQTRSEAPPMAKLLEAVPSVVPGVECCCDAEGLVRLRRKAPARTGWFSWMDRFAPRGDHVFQLDPAGSAFWNAIDGQRDLAAIGAVLQNRYDWMPEHCGNAVVEYTKTMMRRGLIQLRLPGKENHL